MLIFLLANFVTPSKKTMDENWNAGDDLKDGNEGIKDPGRRGRVLIEIGIFKKSTLEKKNAC